jgi:hypothetical protein
VSDLGLAHLTGLTELESLGLVGCNQVTDAGLDHLKGLKKLRCIRLNGTKVTATGVADLQAALPDCRILVDSELQDGRAP